MQAAAAHVGAPLGHDFCVISLSDILKPWTVIEQRIAAAAQADFVLVFYNPVSTQRTWQLQRAKEIMLQWRSPETPVIIARNLGRPGQAVTIKSLDQLTAGDADMRTILLVGSHQTRIIQRSDGRTWVYTPRRYAESGNTPGTLGLIQDAAPGAREVASDASWHFDKVERRTVVSSAILTKPSRAADGLLYCCSWYKTTSAELIAEPRHTSTYLSDRWDR